jgi:hypothetical protein
MTARRYTLLAILGLGLVGLVWGPLTASRPQAGPPPTYAYVSGTFFTKDGLRVFVMNPNSDSRTVTVRIRDFGGNIIQTVNNLRIPGGQTKSVNSACNVCYRSVVIESYATSLAPSAAYLSVRSNPPAPEVLTDQRISAGGFHKFCHRRC